MNAKLGQTWLVKLSAVLDRNVTILPRVVEEDPCPRNVAVQSFGTVRLTEVLAEFSEVSRSEVRYVYFFTKHRKDPFCGLEVIVECPLSTWSAFAFGMAFLAGQELVDQLHERKPVACRWCSTSVKIVLLIQVFSQCGLRVRPWSEIMVPSPNSLQPKSRLDVRKAESLGRAWGVSGVS